MKFFEVRPFRQIVFLCLNVFAISGCSVATLQDTGASATAQHKSRQELNSTDRSIANRNLQAALEKSVSGKSLGWKNPASGTSGSITPLKTWKTAEGRYCRSFSEKIRLASGESMNRQGVACRYDDAVWKSA